MNDLLEDLANTQKEEIYSYSSLLKNDNENFLLYDQDIVSSNYNLANIFKEGLEWFSSYETRNIGPKSWFPSSCPYCCCKKMRIKINSEGSGLKEKLMHSQEQDIQSNRTPVPIISTYPNQILTKMNEKNSLRKRSKRSKGIKNDKALIIEKTQKATKARKKEKSQKRIKTHKSQKKKKLTIKKKKLSDVFNLQMKDMEFPFLEKGPISNTKSQRNVFR